MQQIKIRGPFEFTDTEAVSNGVATPFIVPRRPSWATLGR